MDWMCDLYVYDDVSGGITTHVAGSRRASEPPSVPDILSVTADEFMVAYRRQMDALDAIPLVPIGGPFDGQSFNDATEEDFAARLKVLRAAGYRFPDDLVEQPDA